MAAMRWNLAFVAIGQASLAAEPECGFHHAKVLIELLIELAATPGPASEQS